MNIQSTLKKFIKNCRSKGYSDFEIKKAILNKGYPLKEIEKAFFSLEPKHQYKNQVCLFLGNDLLKVLEKRARKKMMTLSEQIEDVLRRSCVNQINKTPKPKVLDDMLVGIFSRGKRKKNN